MIRGAIAFGLVMKIPYVGAENCPVPEYCYTKEQFSLAVSTCLILVYVTTLVFGTFMKIYQRWALNSQDEHNVHDDAMSHYETMAHPNLEKEKDDPASKPNVDPNAPKGFNESSMWLWFNNYDETVLKPYFIRKYDKNLMAAQEQYHEAVHGNFDDGDVDKISQRIDYLKKANEKFETMSAGRGGGSNIELQTTGLLAKH